MKYHQRYLYLKMLQDRRKETLEGAGLDQAITYSLVSKIMLPILRYKIVLQLNYLCL